MFEQIGDKKSSIKVFCIFGVVILLTSLAIFGDKRTGISLILSWILFAAISYALFCMFMSTAKDVKFDKEHVYVRYPLGKWIEYTWFDFQEVGTYFAGIKQQQMAPSSPSLYFIRKDAKKRRIMGGWPLFNVFKYRKIIELPFNEKTMKALKECCPYPIHEAYRLKTPLY